MESLISLFRLWWWTVSITKILSFLLQRLTSQGVLSWFRFLRSTFHTRKLELVLDELHVFSLLFLRLFLWYFPPGGRGLVRPAVRSIAIILSCRLQAFYLAISVFPAATFGLQESIRDRVTSRLKFSSEFLIQCGGPCNRSNGARPGNVSHKKPDLFRWEGRDHLGKAAYPCHLSCLPMCSPRNGVVFSSTNRTPTPNLKVKGFERDLWFDLYPPQTVKLQRGGIINVVSAPLLSTKGIVKLVSWCMQPYLLAIFQSQLTVP